MQFVRFSKGFIGLLIAPAAIALAAGAAGGQIIIDGDMDALTPGTAPDCGTPNGAWQFPQNYIDATLCERLPVDSQIVTTDSFDPGALGNSFGIDISDPDTLYNMHVTNLFDQVLTEADSPLVTVSFDVFVAEEGRGGASIYIGGDHGGGGFDNTKDRGPQMAFFPDGTIQVNQQGTQLTVVNAYPFGKWQSIQVDIDLVSDTFDMFWGLRGEDLTQVGEDLKFRVVALDHLDRFSMAHFGATIASDHVYYDNIIVRVPEGGCPPDLDGSGSLDLFDFLAFNNLFNAQDPQADWDGNGTFDLFDFLGYVNSFNAGC